MVDAPSTTDALNDNFDLWWLVLAGVPLEVASAASPEDRRILRAIFMKGAADGR